MSNITASSQAAPTPRDILETSSYSEKLSPTLPEFIATIATLALYGFGQSMEAFDFANLAGPTLFSIGLAWACWKMVFSGTSNLWAPLLWYRVAFLTYFGIGALVPSFVNGQTRDLMNQFFLAYGRDVIKLNILLTTFHLIVISTARWFLYLLDYRQSHRLTARNSSILPSNIGVFPLGLMCLGAGSAINYFVILPSIFNLYRISSLSSLANFSSISLVGYFMLTYWSLKNKSRIILYLVIAVAAGETAIGIIAMTKLVALLPVVMIGMGFIFHKTSVIRISIFSTLVLTVFIFMAPAITYAREVNQQYYAGNPSASEIVDIYKSYFGTNRMVSSMDSDDYQTGWMRLSYTNAGSFAISQFDHGLPGDSYKYLPIVLIPRFIYPSKPVVTDVAREFSYAANGNYNSSSSAGLPAEAYWDYGWTGTVIVAVAIGIVMSIWSAYSFLVINRESWHLFFVVLLGMRISTRIDGALVGDIVGPLGVAILAHIALSLLNRFLPSVLSGLRFPRKKMS